MAENSLTSHRPGLAVILKLSGLFLVTIMSGLIKATSGDVPPGEAVFFRSLFAIPVIVIGIAVSGSLRQGVKIHNPMGHLKRGIMGSIAMALTFTGLGMLPLPEVTAIGFAAPIFTLILAAMFLGERIRMIRLSAVLIGLVGVMIMLWPRLVGGPSLENTATLGALCILGATVFRAMVQIQVRMLVRTDQASAIVFWFSVMATCLSLLTLPFGWTVPSQQAATLLITAGVIGGVAQFLITSALRFGPASMLAPYDYSSMLFAIVIGYFWFAELPTVVMLLGATLVIAGNILVILRERQLGLERARRRAIGDLRS